MQWQQGQAARSLSGSVARWAHPALASCQRWLQPHPHTQQAQCSCSDSPPSAPVWL